MIGFRAEVRTLSSMRESKSFCVDACSIMVSGVVNTMGSAIDEGRFPAVRLFVCRQNKGERSAASTL